MEDAKLQAQRAHELHKLKKEAIAYYQSNGVPLKMEDALNRMFRERPDCVYGYLSGYFDQLAEPPSISAVRCHSSWDSRGLETLAAEVTCRHKNSDRLTGRSQACLQHAVPEHERQEERDRELQELRQHVAAGLRLVNDGGPLGELAQRGLDPRCQRDIDDCLTSQLVAEEERVRAELEREAEEAAAAAAAAASGEEAEGSPQHQAKQPAEKPEKAAAAAAAGSAKKRGGGKGGKEVTIVPDEPSEGVFPGCLAVSCLSSACAVAGAAAADLPLYRHLRRGDERPQEWRLPLPMLTILCGGKASPGKSCCVKEYMIVARPHLPFDRVLPDAVAVYQQVARTLGVKGGPAARFSNDAGGLNATIDRPETGFDLINDALKALELTDAFDLAANISGQELFDYEKGKYEAAQGGLKSPDEFADLLDDLAAKQPSLVALIDPLRRAERDAWARLCQKASQRCLIVGDVAQLRPGRLLAELQQEEEQQQQGDAGEETVEVPEQQQQPQQQLPPLLASGWMARLQQRTTVTELLDCAQLVRQSGGTVLAGVGPSDSGETTIIDLAVAMGARFVKLGAPVRAERVDKLLRLAEIGEELQRCGELGQWEPLCPPALRPRGSAASPDAAAGTHSQAQSHAAAEAQASGASKSRKSSSSVAAKS